MNDRRHFLGASEVAAALGLSEWRTPRDVWREKVATVPIEQQDTEDMLRGRASEPVIEALLHLRGETLLPGGEWSIPGTSLVVHPDRRRETALGIEVVEFKAPRRWTGWDEDAPQEYVVQVLVQAFACGASACRVVALCGEMRDFPVPWQHDVAERLVELADRWWNYHVVGGNEPPPVSRREIAKVVPSLPAVVVDQDTEWNLRRLKGWQALARAAGKMANDTKDKLFGRLLDGKDVLPVKLFGADGIELATIRHARRDGYTVDAAEWNEIRVNKNLPMLMDSPDAIVVHHLDETPNVTLE